MAVFYTPLEIDSVVNPYQLEITLETIFRPFGMIFANLHDQILARRLFVKHDQYVPALPASVSRLLSLAGFLRPKRRRDSSL